jgi:type I restriction-modification system DNA methylase subunit
MRPRFSGIDIVPEVVRLCAKNLYLHDIAGRESPIEARDALLGDGGKTYDVVLTNPPFGTKQSYRIVRDDGEIDRARGLRPPGLFRDDLEQAAQFSAAHHDGPGRERQGRRRDARQRPVRGRRRRDDPPPAIAQF